MGFCERRNSVMDVMLRASTHGTRISLFLLTCALALTVGAVHGGIGEASREPVEDGIVKGDATTNRLKHGLDGVAGSETVDQDSTDSDVNTRPNIVLILADDFGWGDVATNNPDSAMTTPNIDGIAAAGANFANAHAPSTVCSPTRYGLLTGRYAWRTWLHRGTVGIHERPLISPGQPTLGTILQDNGYRTAAIGKWHLGMELARLTDISKVDDTNKGVDFGPEILDGPTDHGFDEFFGTLSNVDFEPRVYIQNREFSADPNVHEPEFPGFYDSIDVLDRLTEEAVEFVQRSTAEEEPFFLYLPLHVAHTPASPSEEFDGVTGLGKHADYIAHMDSAVGELLNTIDDAGVGDDTIVIFTSDNGSHVDGVPVPNHVDHNPNAPWRGKKKTIYQGGHRIPLFMRWPNVIEEGSTIDSAVSLVDLYATFADILDEDPEQGVAVDSVSVMPVIRGEADSRGRPIVVHSYNGLFGVIDGRWKLIFGDGEGRSSSTRWPKDAGSVGEPSRLYDLVEDPSEENNLLSDERTRVARIKSKFNRIYSAEEGTLSSDTTLKSIIIAGVEMPAFDPEVRNYQVIVDSDLDEARVTALPTVSDSRVAITTPDGRREYDYKKYGRYGHGQALIRFSQLVSDIEINVTSANREETATYVVRVVRVPSAVWAGKMTTVADSGLTPDRSGYSIYGRRGSLSPNQFEFLGDSYRANFLVHTGAGLVFGLNRAPPRDFTLIVGGKEYRASESLVPPTLGEQGYWWPSTAPDWTPGEKVNVVLSMEPEAEIGDRAKAPITGFFNSYPEDHNGINDVSLRLYFSEVVTASAEEIADDVLSVSGGAVSGVEAVGGQGYIWRVSITPSTRVDPVSVEIAGGLDCTAAGAVCATDGRRLYHTMTLSIPMRVNNPSKGRPVISGQYEIGATLTADVSGISDPDGIPEEGFAFQWRSNDGNGYASIPGAVGSSYTVTDSDLDKALKVRVSFTDDATFEETAESYPATWDRAWGLTAQTTDAGVRLRWRRAVDNLSTSMYRILRHRPEMGDSDPLVLVDYTFSSSTSYTDTSVEPGVLYVYSVQSVDTFGYTSESSDPASLRVPGVNSPALGAPTINGEAHVGETLRADTSGISDPNGMVGAVFSYQWWADDVEIQGATADSYTLVTADSGKSIEVTIGFTDDGGNEESLTSAATVAVMPAFTAQFLDAPASHDGVSVLRFEVRFSENAPVSYRTLIDEAFTVTGGSVRNARRFERSGATRNIRWEITVEPDGDDDVRIILPATEDCAADGAICASDNRKLSNRSELTVKGPGG